MLSTSRPFSSKIFHCWAAKSAMQQIEAVGYETRIFVLGSCAPIRATGRKVMALIAIRIVCRNVLLGMRFSS
jgi:hypothetical protein